MSITIDTRGLSCPEPIFLTSQAIEQGVFPIEVQVDSVTTRENIRRLAQSRKLKIVVNDVEDGFLLILDKA